MQEKNSYPLWIGIDVSKDSFTAACRSIVRDERTRFPLQDEFSLDKKGVGEFMRWAKEQAGCFEIGMAMEATGVYSRRLAGLIRSVSTQQHVAICNARSVSLYARSFSDEKNDKIDAERIAMYACDRNPQQPRAKDKAEARLQELVRERDRMVERRQAMVNSGEVLESADIRKIHAAVLKGMEKAIAKLDRLIGETVSSSGEIKEEVRRMTSIPGVGITSAACIYAELGSLKNYTRKQISAMSGVCPANRKSGASVDRHGISRRGSSLLRKILYLDSFQAIRLMPPMNEFHARMLAKPNSSKKTARCACMRKLLLILHAMVVNDSDYIPGYKPEKRIISSEKTA